MPIPLSNYVSITSGLAAANNVSTRNLGGLIITNNILAPTGTVLNFTSAAAVGTYFGTTSEEYLRAVFYFGWISPNITTPNQLSYYFWNNNAATGSFVYGAQQVFTLATFTAITSGSFTLTLGGFTHTLTGINLSGAGNLAAVASAIQTAIRAYSTGGSAWTGATVTYSATPAQGGNPQFIMTSGTVGADTIAIVAGASNDVAGPLGWLTGAILSNGNAAETITANLNNLLNISNNFGSFCYTTALNVTLTNIEAAATWNNSLTPNLQFIFSIAVTAANASSWSAGLLTTGGCALTLVSPQTGAYAEMEPMMVLAATNYNARNGVMNYMFRVFNDTPSVTTQANQILYDGLLINYYGQTENAGQNLSFYQRGVMMGIATQPQDMNVYANEIWLKDAIGASIMTLLLSLAQVPANSTGIAMLTGAIQPIVNQALLNGTISVGKPLSAAQQLYITQTTGSPTAWQQVQNTGYWLNVTVSSYVANSITQWKAVYTLMYAKDDIIRYVQGSDILI